MSLDLQAPLQEVSDSSRPAYWAAVYLFREFWAIDCNPNAARFSFES